MPQQEPSYWLMNYEPVVIAWDLKNHIKSVHTSSPLLIDAVILSSALTITLVLRAKGNAARKK